MIKPEFKQAARKQYVLVEIRRGVYVKMPVITLDCRMY